MLRIHQTSVDHGTALDVTGKKMADPASLVEATLLVAQLAARREAMRR
jgi:4-hydroxy-L-threonine phosphate dehydrogenase PdxA